MAESYTSTYAANGAAVDAALAKADTALQPSDVQTDAADRTEGRIARIDLVPVDPFREVCQIAGMEPTLYLDFARQDYRLYNSATGLERKALTDILDSESGDIRAFPGTAYNALGLLEEQAADVPRLDFDPETGICRGVLVEESRTNLLDQDILNTSGASNGDLFHVAQDQTDIGGLSKAWRIYKDGTETAPSGQVYLYAPTTIANSTQYTTSVIIKPEQETVWQLVVHNTITDYGSNQEVDFDLTGSGRITRQESLIEDATVEALLGGRYRLTVTWTSGASSGGSTVFGLLLYPLTYTSANSLPTNGNWGLVELAQLEPGAFATSPIRTSGSTATRAADTLTISGTRFSDFWNPSEGSFVFSYAWKSSALSDYSCLFSFSDGSADNRIQLRRSSYSAMELLTRVSGGSINDIGAFLQTGTAAMTFDGASVSVELSSGTSLSLSSAIPTVDHLYLAANQAGSVLDAMSIERCCYFPRKLTNTQLQLLSSLGA